MMHRSRCDVLTMDVIAKCVAADVYFGVVDVGEGDG